MSTLSDIAAKLKEDPTYEHLPITTRSLLRMFMAERRGSWVVSRIRGELKRLGLETVPNFENTWIDSPLQLRLLPAPALTKKSGVAELTAEPTVPPDASEADSDEQPDSAFRIGRLESVTRKVVSVNPESSLQNVATLMMSQHFSQLPVMVGQRQVKGMVTWMSIGASLAMGQQYSKASDYMLPHFDVREDTSLFEALPGIIENGYVLLRGADDSVNGILTVGDLSRGLHQLAEPFLLLQEIEMFIRRLLKRVPQSDFSQHTSVLLFGDDRESSGATIEDLSLGEYLRLLENPAFWTLLKLHLDRSAFIEQLHRVRNIRNRVMHFDQDGMKPEDLLQLRDCSHFFRTLSELILRSPKPKKPVPSSTKKD